MCIIAVCNDRKLTDAELLNCWENNSDGAGMAWFDKKEHVIKKGFMNYDLFKAEYASIDILPHIVHFRIATAGGVIPELTHPFICTKKSPLSLEWRGKEPVLFHNGIVFNWLSLAEMLDIQLPNPYWSDTRVLSSIISQWGMDFLEEEGGKYAVLFEKEIQIFGKFIEESGIKFSNPGYENVWFTYNDYSYKGTKSYSSTYVNGKSGRINVCNSCPDGNTNICNYCADKENSPWLKIAAKSNEYMHCDYCRHYPGSWACSDCPDAPLEKKEPIRDPNFCDLTSNKKCVYRFSTYEIECPDCYIYKSKKVSMEDPDYCEFTPDNKCAFRYAEHCPSCETCLSFGYREEKEHIPFSECDGKCDTCDLYDAKTNSCTEVDKELEGRKERLLLLEHKIDAQLRAELSQEHPDEEEYEECRDKGEACYTCASFDSDKCRCSVWD